MNNKKFNALPGLNKQAVASGQPKGAQKMLYSITPEGRIKLNRDISKYRSKKVGPRHHIYFSDPPSPREREHNAALQVVISQFSKELTLDNERAIQRKEGGLT